MDTLDKCCVGAIVTIGLGFVMKEKYNKVWDRKIWIKGGG